MGRYPFKIIQLQAGFLIQDLLARSCYNQVTFDLGPFLQMLQDPDPINGTAGARDPDDDFPHRFSSKLLIGIRTQELTMF